MIRWGIIGCGSVTEVKSGPAYGQVEGFKIEAVMRRNLELAKDYAKRHQIDNYYDDADRLINDSNIDAVYIATPPDSHHYYALRVSEAGKICCIEKPMAPSYAACVEINEAFSSKNLPLYVAYYRRSLPRFKKVKSILESDVIGTVRHLHWGLCKPVNDIDTSKTYNWRTDKSIAPGGYFDDLASHGLDLFTYLLGDIKEASGMSENQQELYSAADAVTGSWMHANGISGSGFWNFGAFHREDKVEIIGSHGKIIFSVFDEEPITLTTKNGSEEFVVENPKHIQYYHVLNMKKDLESIEKHPSTGISAMHTSWVMDKILGKL